MNDEHQEPFWWRAPIGIVNHDGLRRLAQNVSGVKIAVAQVIAIGHIPEAIQPSGC